MTRPAKHYGPAKRRTDRLGRPLGSMAARKEQVREAGERYRDTHDEAMRVRLWRVRNPEKYAAQIARNNAKRQERRGK